MTINNTLFVRKLQNALILQSFGFEECVLVGLPPQEVLEEVHGVLGAAGGQDLVPVVQAHLGVEEALFAEAGLEHVEAEHLAPLERESIAHYSYIGKVPNKGISIR